MGIKKSNMLKDKHEYKFYVLVVLFTIILLSFNFGFWYLIRTTTISQISQNTLSKANYYANEIEIKNDKIRLALQEIAKGSSRIFEDDLEKWNEQTNPYIENYIGIEDILFVDTNFTIIYCASENTNEYILGQKIKNQNPISGSMHIYAPVYRNNKLEGFIFSNVNIIKLAMSVFLEDHVDYEISIFEGNKEVFVSKKWDESNKDFVKEVKFSVDSASSYLLRLKPTVEWQRINLRHTKLILVFGITLILGIVIVIFIAKNSINKSRMLLETKLELQQKNEFLQKQLRNQQKLESIGVVASGVAHEIRNPINGVVNYSQLIMDGSNKDSDSYNFSKEIIIEMKRISDLVSNILLFSRKEKEKGYSNARIEDIIERSVSLVSTIIKKDNIKIDIVIDENIPIIKCRSQQIQQVLMNLLFNAKDSLNEKYDDYDDEKKIIIFVKKINISSEDYVRITVRDLGTGIDDSIKNKIFEKFFTTKSEQKGTGLGLSISYAIAKEHNGNLFFETKLGSYTEFYLDLPVEQNKR